MYRFLWCLELHTIHLQKCPPEHRTCQKISWNLLITRLCSSADVIPCMKLTTSHIIPKGLYLVLLKIWDIVPIYPSFCRKFFQKAKIERLWRVRGCALAQTNELRRPTWKTHLRYLITGALWDPKPHHNKMPWKQTEFFTGKTHVVGPLQPR